MDLKRCRLSYPNVGYTYCVNKGPKPPALKVLYSTNLFITAWKPYRFSRVHCAHGLLRLWPDAWSLPKWPGNQIISIIMMTGELTWMGKAGNAEAWQHWRRIQSGEITLHEAAKSWRVPITHFTLGLQLALRTAGGCQRSASPHAEINTVNDPCKEGSIIEYQNQALGSCHSRHLLLPEL